MDDAVGAKFLGGDQRRKFELAAHRQHAVLLMGVLAKRTGPDIQQCGDILGCLRLGTYRSFFRNHRTVFGYAQLGKGVLRGIKRGIAIGGPGEHNRPEKPDNRDQLGF
ncbi:hypothetical protein DSECCO2_612410 [anaerobic digester metagenome]